jgi:hypothetical protein
MPLRIFAAPEAARNNHRCTWQSGLPMVVRLSDAGTRWRTNSRLWWCVRWV